LGSVENDKRIYFMAETQGTLNRQLLREVENMKIACDEKHFALFKPLGVEYKLAVKTKDLY
jgi:type III restriction enzyme